ncbi:hypothetical protein NLU13_0602 [Sarocladium strictum]|uniref:DNA topoisomerase 2 n=1 Tax=Sarocladium strictum TaxID=5046 RepID=A0AA39LBK7_SARSR|nr:hypothetical protein NLU13_0602 [Sarocladium strictum]
MASDMSDGSVFGVDDESDAYVPEVKPKAAAVKKAAAAKPAPKKKMVQSTLKTTKAAPKKRPPPPSDDESDAKMDESGFSNTPPSAKKQKPTPPVKKAGGVPLAELENDSLMPDTPEKAAPKTKKTATQMYQKLSQIEHIIKRPDTYIGSVERTEQQMWVFNKETSLMEYRTVNFVPGLYKIFDEILVNAADNKQRDASMTQMKINIDRAEGVISVENNGQGIPVVIHEQEKIYIPELIFGHLLAGSNFDDDEKKTVGGRNGYGAKLCNVFSTEFTLECQDSEHGKRYKQTWTDNMQKMGKAKITSSKTSDFTRVTFKPDFNRFGMPEGIDDDLEALLYRRVYDMAGTVRGIKVHLNGEHIKLKDFKSYCDLYAKSIAKERSLEEGGEPTCTVEIDKDKGHPRWEVGFAVSDGTFQQVSFVNSIATTSGGTHVNYIADQITGSLLKQLNKRKKGHTLKQNQLKNHIFIFVNCLISNPAFTSQTKEQMTTKPSAFGSKCNLGEDFLKKIGKSEAIQNILEAADRKADKLMAKSDGSKRSRVSNAKLVEANLAGTRRGHECTLILTEGDSAKGLAVSGRAMLDPDRIGVFPLRGKMLNVRDASIDQITKNSEIQNIKQFLGLKHKQVYTDTKSLRYGHLMIMADQDHDGSHIKGLLINFLQVQYPSLLQIDDFFQEFITPIVKVWQGNPKEPTKSKFFFTQPEYEDWKDGHAGQLSKWESKYLKGLGTSTADDAKSYFSKLDEHLKNFETMKPEEADMFDLVFSKKKADARKEWLGNFVPGTYLDHSASAITYNDFVNKELILFSMADNMRSIPSVLDGLKPGQRKVMFGIFKRNQIKDKKVVDLAGYVSGTTAYHHGETSLQQTIIGLAQNYVGSNNINCLEPSGMFGSRLQGGSDAASPRYIYTRLTPFARKIYSKLDEPNLKTQYEEGSAIEPEVYYPVIPMILVNGADGIGTGWSTSIPNYHPMDIVNNLRQRMGRVGGEETEERPFVTMTPWFRGWKGTPEPAGPDRYKFNGIAYQSESNPNEVVITELPIRMWTDDFKARLEKIISGVDGPSWIKDYKEFNDHNVVHFEIQCDEKHMPKILEEGLLERFKLTKQVATSNLVAFNARGQIRKYEKVEDILEEYYEHRLVMYTKRKEHWLAVYHAEYRKLSNQARFIKEIIDGELVVGRKKKDVLVQELRTRKYEPFPRGADAKKKTTEDEINEEHDEEEENMEGGARDYDYLLSMPLWSLTLERLEKLKQAIANKKQEHDALEKKSEKDLWVDDLDEFCEEWARFEEEEAENAKKIRKMGRRVSKKIGAGNVGGRKKAKNADDDEYDPGKKAKGKAKAAPVKVEAKASKLLAEKFSAKPAKPKELPQAEPSPRVEEIKDDSSDNDFSALSRTKPTAQGSQISNVTKPASEPVADAGRNKRAAAAKSAKAFLIDSDSELDDNLGDVGAMVKGIGAGEDKGRVSLYAMNRPQSSHGNGSDSLPKLKTKPSKRFDADSADETNYEMLANSSPYKAPGKDNKLVDDLLSDNDDAPAPAPEPKKRGRPAAASKAAPKEAAKPKAAKKSTVLSPAAKAYAARKNSARDESDDEMAEADSPPPKPAARGRPGRAAAARRPIIVDEDSSSMVATEEEESDDPFDMDDE